MTQQLETIVQRLSHDPLFAITVEYPDPFKRGGMITVERNATADTLTQRYGSPKQFFEEIYSRGIKSIVISPRRQNGRKDGRPSYKPDGESLPFLLSGGQAQEQADETTTIMTSYPPPPGMNGAGLNAVQQYHAMDYQRLLGEYNNLKAKAERLEDKNRELDRELFQKTVASENSSGMREMLAGALPHLPELIASMKGGGAAMLPAAVQTGMSGADRLTPEARELMEIVAENPDMATTLLTIINGMATSEALGERIMEVLREFNLVETEPAL